MNLYRRNKSKDYTYIICVLSVTDGLTRPTLTLGSGKFPSPTGWGERRMRRVQPDPPDHVTSRDALTRLG
jgi:hypothetical protein